MSMAAPSTSLVSKVKRIFPGWWIVVVGGLQFGWAQAPSQLGIFLKPLQEAFGWSRAQISVAASLQRLEGGVEAIPEGLAIDKWGPRAIQLVGVTGLGLALLGMYFVDSLWMFYIAWVLVATGHNVGYGGCLDKAVTDWYVKKRGLMLSIMRSINSGLTPIALLVVSWLLYTYGWREAFLVSGVVTLVTGLPLTWFFIKPRRPEYYGWLPDGKRIGEEVAKDTEAAIKAGVDYTTETTGEVEFTLRQAIRGRTWWAYLMFYCLRTLTQPVIRLHLIPHLSDVGINPIVAAGMLGTMTLMQVPGRLFFGWLSDRIRITRFKYLILLGVLMEALSVVILIQTTNLAWVWAFVVVSGISQGTIPIGGAIMRARFWGRKAFASISGVARTTGAVVGVAAPIYAGWVYDTTGSYRFAFILLFITMLLAAALTFFLNPPKPPEKIGKITEFV
ncbi:MFS transporter [Chloroflexota bacterium]